MGVEDVENGKKKKKKKKKKVTEYEKDAEIEKFMAELMKEFGLKDNDDIDADNEDDDEDEDEEDDDADDDKEDDNDDGDDDMDDDDDDDNNNNEEAQIIYLKQEMDARGNDLETLKDIMVSSENPKQEMDKMTQAMDERQDAMVNSLEELSCGNEAIKDIKASNDEWKDYMLHLSQSILKESNQKNKIKKISDGFLKELNGRINDLCDINNVYYDEDENIGFEALKNNVDDRHDDISKDIQATNENQEEEEQDENENEDEAESQTNELYQGLLQTNQTWNALISSSSESFKESQIAKNDLIQQLLSKYAKLINLTQKVEAVPATVLF